MLGEDYFYWLCDRAAPINYLQLMKKLAATNYIWQFELDKNRAISGITLRSAYAYEAGVYQSDVADGPCSCLEMLIALADDLVDQSGDGSERSFFCDLLSNLELLDFDDDHYSENRVNYILDKWLSRSYSSSGEGNIFNTSSNVDMRSLDIWQQMMVYINEKYPLDQNFLQN